MAKKEYRKAYDAYQEAVNRDGRNAAFWCSIGVLYYQVSAPTPSCFWGTNLFQMKINQYRDALDAYTRAIHLNPYLPVVSSAFICSQPQHTDIPCAGLV